MIRQLRGCSGICITYLCSCFRYLYFLTSISLRKSENYRLPPVIKLFALPAAVFVILVLTNDMHELVFLFMRDSENMIPLYDMPYSYGLCYWIIQLWNGMVVLTSLVIMIEKCRSPKLGRPEAAAAHTCNAHARVRRFVCLRCRMAEGHPGRYDSSKLSFVYAYAGGVYKVQTDPVQYRTFRYV